MPPSELQQRLIGLAAPGRLVDWARSFPDLETCWAACPSPEWLLWLAARLSGTSDERRTLVLCLAELTKRAGQAHRGTDPAVTAAVDAATTWAGTARAGTGSLGTPLTAGSANKAASLDSLFAAEQAALEVAARATAVAAEEGAKARWLFHSAPRTRPSSFGTSSALGAWAEWHKANYTARLASAAAGTVRAAAEAAWIDVIHVSGATFESADAGDPGSVPGNWVSCAAETAGNAVRALAIAQGSRQDEKTARKLARLVRQRLACPRLG
jgi:hypothetical protein